MKDEKLFTVVSETSKPVPKELLGDLKAREQGTNPSTAQNSLIDVLGSRVVKLTSRKNLLGG